jgi:hypothetical protein
MATRNEWVILNADKEKILAVNGVEPGDDSWDFLWKDPLGYASSEESAKVMVLIVNEERKTFGLLETHGPVKYERRTVSEEF